jgi:hypothetical protein
MGGNEDDLHVGQKGPDFPGQLHPGAAGHFNVQQDQVKEKPILGDVVEEIVAVSIGDDLAGTPALFQAVLRSASIGLDGGAVIVADGNTQHEVIHLPYDYDGILYYGCPALASRHPPVCYEMLSECHEMFCNGHSEAPRIERDKYFSFSY